MELKDNAYLAISSTVLLAILYYAIGDSAFLISAAILISLIALDYALLRYRLASARRHVSARFRLPVIGATLGRPSRLSLPIAYSGPKLTLSLSLPVDDGILVSLLPDRITVSSRKPAEAVVTLTPSSPGKYHLGPPIGEVETLFLKASFTIGDQVTIDVKLPVGRRYLRPDGIRRQGRLFMAGGGAIDKKSGSEFSGIRDYMPGDISRHIDWSRSAKYHKLIVKEFDGERSLPAFLLVDGSVTSREPGISRGLEATMSVIDRLLSDNTPVGLVCFSKHEVTCYLPPSIGRPHARSILKALSEIPADDGYDNLKPNMRRPKELMDMAAEYDKAIGHSVLGPVFEETLKNFSANIRDDGFARAIKKVAGAAKGEHDIIVVTGMAMGMASMSNGIRLAQYYGLHASVILISRGDDDSRLLAEAASKLRGRSVNAMVLQPGRGTGDALYEGRIKTRSRG